MSLSLLRFKTPNTNITAKTQEPTHDALPNSHVIYDSDVRLRLTPAKSIAFHGSGGARPPRSTPTSNHSCQGPRSDCWTNNVILIVSCFCLEIDIVLIANYSPHISSRSEYERHMEELLKSGVKSRMRFKI